MVVYQKYQPRRGIDLTTAFSVASHLSVTAMVRGEDLGGKILPWLDAMDWASLDTKIQECLSGRQSCLMKWGEMCLQIQGA
jgi:hypothetical protein